MKTRLITGFILSVMVMACTKKETVFYAFTDGFMDWYSLDLYPDKTFLLHVPVTDYEGRYRVAGDTIFLHYDEDTAGAAHGPDAYLINGKIIDELEQGELKQFHGAYNNRWMEIRENKLDSFYGSLKAKTK